MARPSPPPLLAPRPRASTPGTPSAWTSSLLLATLLAAPAIQGCSDPAEDAAQAYVEAMQPVLARNMELTRQFVEIATEVKQGRTEAKAVAERFEENLVPEAAALRDAVLAIHPESEPLAATHRSLGEAWTGRVEVYRELHRAWGMGELEAFDRADRKNLEVKAAEERYFSQVNQQLSPMGLVLDPYP